MSKLLATLAPGDRIPGAWANKPAWYTVTQVLGNGEYEVRCPDGTTSTLRDSE